MSFAGFARNRPNGSRNRPEGLRALGDNSSTSDDRSASVSRTASGTSIQTQNANLPGSFEEQFTVVTPGRVYTISRYRDIHGQYFVIPGQAPGNRIFIRGHELSNKRKEYKVWYHSTEWTVLPRGNKDYEAEDTATGEKLGYLGILEVLGVVSHKSNKVYEGMWPDDEIRERAWRNVESEQAERVFEADINISLILDQRHERARVEAEKARAETQSPIPNHDEPGSHELKADRGSERTA